MNWSVLSNEFSRSHTWFCGAYIDTIAKCIHNENDEPIFPLLRLFHCFCMLSSCFDCFIWFVMCLFILRIYLRIVLDWTSYCFNRSQLKKKRRRGIQSQRYWMIEAGKKRQQIIRWKHMLSHILLKSGEKKKK